MIKIFIKKLRFKCIIGLLDFERKNKQKIQIDAVLGSDDFIDYAVVCKYLKKTCIEKEFFKVEDALIFFKNDLKSKFPSLKYIKLKISKLKIIKNAVVGASICEKF